MEFNSITLVDCPEELDFKIGKLEKEYLTIIVILLNPNIIFISGNRPMIAEIIHVGLIMSLRIMQASLINLRLLLRLKEKHTNDCFIISFFIY
jgi:hypothetical protein